MKHTKQTQSILGAAIAARRIHGPYRYALRDPWTLPLVDLELPRFDGLIIRTEPVGEQVRITVKPYSPDDEGRGRLDPKWPRRVRHLALFDDAWDLDTTAMAAAWAWSRDRVRREAPCIITDALMFTSGSAWRARLHYRLVWHLGRLLGLFRLALRRLAGS